MERHTAKVQEPSKDNPYYTADCPYCKGVGYAARAVPFEQFKRCEHFTVIGHNERRGLYAVFDRPEADATETVGVGD